MSITKTFSFTNPANYTYDSDKISISSGARLKLVDNPDQLFSQNFVSDSGYTYDSDLIEFVSNVARQKYKRPSNAIFYASYTNNINSSWGEGTLTATVGGTANVHDGYLDLSGGNAYVEYPVDNFVSMNSNSGCIRERVAFDYTGGAPSVQYLLQTSPNTISRVYLVHNDVYIQCYIFNSAGALIYNMTFGWTPTQGQVYEFEVNWSGTNAYIFINGQLKDSDTGSLFIGIPTLFRLGQSSNSKIKIYDIAVFNTLQHSSNYTPSWSNFYEYDYLESTIVCPEMEYTGLGTLISADLFTANVVNATRFSLQIGRSGDYLYWDGAAWIVSDGTYAQSTSKTDFNTNIASLPVEGEIYGQFKIHFPNSNDISSITDFIISLTAQIYPTDNPTILINDYFDMEELLGFTESSTLSGSDLVKYILSKDGTYYYWNGSEWAESDETYSQANTASEIETNKASFMSSEARVFVKVFLHSENGSTAPELTSVSVSYDFGGDISEPTTIIVWGNQYYPDGTPSQKTIIVELEPNANEYSTSNQIVKKKITITPRSNGYWEQELVDNANMETDSHYIFRFGSRIEKKVVPSGTSVNYNNLTDYNG